VAKGLFLVLLSIVTFSNLAQSQIIIGNGADSIMLNFKDTGLFRSPETLKFLKFTGSDSSKVYLGFGDKNWFAISHCLFTFQNKPCAVDIILEPEGDENVGYKWVIFDVKSTIFPLPIQASKKTSFINPMDHEVGFSELSKALTKKNSIYQYTSATYRPDYLSEFLIMVKTGVLRFNQINSVDFQFLQVSGWAFTVKNFNRSDYNSGWLISSIKKMSDAEKGTYIEKHFIEQ